ncbi:MAG: hypothetical protein HA495_02975 [Thaumarchaeota archaeon]|jgi:hypothetical protein|nr:hypothetical protein [Nitrososphaerota archaeon]
MRSKRRFLFLTFEGVTYSSPEETEPDVENLQVLGYAEGKNKEEAFENFLKENKWILETSFSEVICIEVKERISEGKTFYIER